MAEADVGSIKEGQEVKFTVDAFPNRTFAGKVRMVRNAASSNQSVVSYDTIIDVANDDMKLKPGMTATESDIIMAVRDRLAGYKKPKRVFFIDEMPKTVSGKLVKWFRKYGANKEATRKLAEIVDAEARRPLVVGHVRRAALRGFAGGGIASI